MTKIGLFYGTETGYTQTAAEMIQKEFVRESIVSLLDISQAEQSDFNDYSYIIISCHTWNAG